MSFEYVKKAGTSLVCCASVAFSLAQEPQCLKVDEVASRMLKAELAQEKNLQHYRSRRMYQLTNDDGSKSVQMVAQVDYDSNLGKSIKVIEERGAEGMFRRALRKVIEAEMKASLGAGRDETRLSPENYAFRMLNTEVRNGRKCYVLELQPKRKSKFLLDGKAWIDAEDYALVALEGRPSASVSFWVGKPYISQSFEKVGDYWLLVSNHSVADAKLVGRIALSISTSAFEMDGTKIAVAAPAGRSKQSVD